ncbi:hypothetical protein HELRODRAFT_160172 [Helobdella robusta]|uniref:Uncharacterized protein n=1 Tax=Helobdella robusta TaxID=6412 RepID=T1EPX2_HELRO|nr:hypothetical protein HELRODRAFT_160172 [Helobdella robusta]ESO06049.1 hypothetical protein HELRODRAFT_160172 [Helobdella robusta]
MFLSDSGTDVNEDVLGVEVPNQQDSHKLIVPTKFHKVVGNKTESLKLKAKKIPRFRLYIVNFLDFTSADVIDKLKANHINVISCYPIQKKKPDDNSELKDNVLANAFRICINKQEFVKIKDPNIWPSGFIIRDWIFNKQPNQIKDHTMESSNNKNTNKEQSTVNVDNHEKTSTNDGGT